MKEKQKRYYDKHVTPVSFNCIDTTDADIIVKIKSVPNKSGYIKKLIREDIARNQEPKQ